MTGCQELTSVSNCWVPVIFDIPRNGGPLPVAPSRYTTSWSVHEVGPFLTVIVAPLAVWNSQRMLPRNGLVTKKTTQRFNIIQLCALQVVAFRLCGLLCRHQCLLAQPVDEAIGSSDVWVAQNVKP